MKSKPNSKTTTVTFQTKHEAWHSAYCGMVVAGLNDDATAKRFLRARARGLKPTLPGNMRNAQVTLLLALAEIAADAFAPDKSAVREKGRNFSLARYPSDNRVLTVGVVALTVWASNAKDTIDVMSLPMGLVRQTWCDLVIHVAKPEFAQRVGKLAIALFEGSDGFESRAHRERWFKSSLEHAPNLQLTFPITSIGSSCQIVGSK